ncbi:Uncharacterised protein [Chlamydia trachomatis]|nr:Uncharacterised protein [Chlamydia trachomatis]
MCAHFYTMSGIDPGPLASQAINTELCPPVPPTPPSMEPVDLAFAVAYFACDDLTWLCLFWVLCRFCVTRRYKRPGLSATQLLFSLPRPALMQTFHTQVKSGHRLSRASTKTPGVQYRNVPNPSGRTREAPFLGGR